MKIQVGHTFINKTYRYLRPCMSLYGTTFVTKFNSFQKLAYGLHDTLLDNTPIQHQKTLFILLDRSVQPNIFKDSLNWMRLQDFYITDYPFQDLEGRQHMLVLLFPEEYSIIYDNFTKSKYSLMYLQQEIDLFFPDKDSYERAVIQRAPIARMEFTEEVNRRFNTDVDSFINEDDMEYEFPLSRKQEYFNQK